MKLPRFGYVTFGEMAESELDLSKCKSACQEFVPPCCFISRFSSGLKCLSCDPCDLNRRTRGIVFECQMIWVNGWLELKTAQGVNFDSRKSATKTSVAVLTILRPKSKF